MRQVTLSNNGATQQIIGREGETASLLKLALFPRGCVSAVSPHVNSIVRLQSFFVCFIIRIEYVKIFGVKQNAKKINYYC